MYQEKSEAVKVQALDYEEAAEVYVRDENGGDGNVFMEEVGTDNPLAVDIFFSDGYVVARWMSEEERKEFLWEIDDANGD